MRSVGAVTINSSYVHTSPSVRILRNIARAGGIRDAWCDEFLPTNGIPEMAARIIERKAPILGISVHIWNRHESLELAREIKRLSSGTRIIAGGPGLSSDMMPPIGVDVLVRGEGEMDWARQLGLDAAHAGPSFFYTEEDAALLKNRIVYVESTRGCNNSCAFCQSGSAQERERPYLPAGGIDALVRHVAWLSACGAKCIKFLDRTFNSSPARSLELMKLLHDAAGRSQIHFEIRPELLDEQTIEFLSSCRPGAFRLEAGVQSLNAIALKASGRGCAPLAALAALGRLVSAGTAVVHADLLWGLPRKDMRSIKTGFDRLYLSGPPEEIQLGFLKLLPGTRMRDIAKEHAYIWNQTPPYEFIQNNTLCPLEVAQLKKFARAFNVFYNSGRFSRTIPLALARSGLLPFAFFEKLALALEESGPSNALDGLFRIFLNQFGHLDPIADHLRLDYALGQKVMRLPGFLTAQVDITLADERCLHVRRDNSVVFLALEHAPAPHGTGVFEKKCPALYRIDRKPDGLHEFTLLAHAQRPK